VLFASTSAGTEGLARHVQAKWNQIKEIETKINYMVWLRNVYPVSLCNQYCKISDCM